MDQIDQIIKGCLSGDRKYQERLYKMFSARMFGLCLQYSNNYDDAKAICQAYGGRLAKYEEIESAYKKGAGWCNYGWSDKQMALFPTQKEKWEHLQKIKGHEHDCGRQGINGGYIANPNVRFGVNCYGYKPKITKEEVDLMANTPLYPRTQREIDFDKRVNYWRDKLPEILVAPFNNNNWSII